MNKVSRPEYPHLLSIRCVPCSLQEERSSTIPWLGWRFVRAELPYVERQISLGMPQFSPASSMDPSPKQYLTIIPT